MMIIQTVYKQRMLISDVFMGNPFVKWSDCEIFGYVLYTRVSLGNPYGMINQYNVSKTARLSLFVYKEVGLQMHLIRF